MVWIALACFAFTQLAVAAYVCSDTAASAQAQATGMHEGDCHRLAGRLQQRADAQLCKAYCERDAQAKPSALADVPDPAGGAALALFPPTPLPLALERSEASFPSHGDPPLYLRNCVLRN